MDKQVYQALWVEGEAFSSNKALTKQYGYRTSAARHGFEKKSSVQPDEHYERDGFGSRGDGGHIGSWVCSMPCFDTGTAGFWHY
jgi:hypothetical protein